MNSFTFIRRGIDAAVREQIAAYERGETLEQSTYDYDPDTDRLTVHRSKEEADDYRYFPEPDLVPVEPPAELVERLRGELGELPGSRIRRIEAEVGYDLAYELVATGNEREGGCARRARRRLARGGERRDEPARRDGSCPRTRPRSRRSSKANVTRDALDTPRSPRAREPGFDRAEQYLAQTAVSDESELEPAIDAVLAANPQQVETYRGGKEGVLGFLVGQVMKETRRQGRPEGRQPASAGEAAGVIEVLEPRRSADRRAERADDRGGERPAGEDGDRRARRRRAQQQAGRERAERDGEHAQRARHRHRRGRRAGRASSAYQYAVTAESVFGKQNACAANADAST